MSPSPSASVSSLAHVLTSAPDGGVAVVNADDAFGSWFEQQVIRAGDSGRRVLRFGLEASAEVTARDIVATGQGSRFVLATPQGQVEVSLALPGRHNVRNALAAAAIALACEVPLERIAAGLADAQPVPGRQVAHVLPGGALLIDDSYNANPGSVAAAIDALAASGDEAWLVLGDMRELGPEAEALHADAGERLRLARLEIVTYAGHHVPPRADAAAIEHLDVGSGGAATADETVAGVTFSGQVLDGLDPKELRPLLDAAKQRMGSGVAAVIAVNDGKASIAAAVTDDLTARFSAVDLVRAGVEALGGKGGGGRPDMAQGGGPDGSKAAEALAAVKAAMAG